MSATAERVDLIQLTRLGNGRRSAAAARAMTTRLANADERIVRR